MMGWDDFTKLSSIIGGLCEKFNCSAIFFPDGRIEVIAQTESDIDDVGHCFKTLRYVKTNCMSFTAAGVAQIFGKDPKYM